MEKDAEAGFGMSRRVLLQTAAATCGLLLAGGLDGAFAAAGGLRLGEARPFDFEELKRRAKSLAAAPYVAPVVRGGDVLDRIDFDAHNKIRYDEDATLWGDDPDSPAVRFFHLGRYARLPVDVHVVDRDGTAREILYSEKLFTMPADSPARELPADLGFAGLRVMDAGQTDDWLAFLGASYFRTSGPLGQFGLSARGLAIDTAYPGRAEEFPRFTTFWLEPRDATSLVIYALLDSESVAGAYRILSEKREDGIVQEIEADLHPRRPIDRFGIAPLTSMYWYGENSRYLAQDWRPEIHDSDGLEMWAGDGERIWRPLNNPPRVMVNSFADRGPRGFGLMQRDRDFDNYQDDGVFYNRRASLWVEPLGDWGAGAVDLVELPTDDEVHDNIVAFWCPKEPAGPGSPSNLRYRLHWLARNPYPADVATLFNLRLGAGGIPGQSPRPKGVTKFALDFQGDRLKGLTRDSGVKAHVEASRGTLDTIAAYPVVGEPYWRVIFDLKAEGEEPVDLRIYLSRNGDALSETVLYQFFPAPFQNALAVAEQ